MAETKTLTVGTKLYYNGKKHEVVGFPSQTQVRLKCLACGGGFKTVDIASLKV